METPYRKICISNWINNVWGADINLGQTVSKEELEKRVKQPETTLVQSYAVKQKKNF